MTSLHLAVLLMVVVGSAHSLDAETATYIRSKVQDMIRSDPVESGLPPNNLRMIGGLIRLIFHDCVSDACDGCINLNNPENNGLQGYITRAEQLYQELSEEYGGVAPLSRADFWALAATEAVYFSTALSRRGAVPDIDFKFGRVDCIGSPTTNTVFEFPSPHGSAQDTVRFFREHFGFNTKETTAILGAHTVGRAHREASGFNHPWVQRQDRFDNQFYADMMDSSKGWNQQNVGRNSDPKVLWESTRERLPITMMLNSDMTLLKDIGPLNSTGYASCVYGTCPNHPNDVRSSTAYWVERFANDNDLFIRQFSLAFTKMIGHGYEQLNALL